MNPRLRNTLLLLFSVFAMLVPVATASAAGDPNQLTGGGDWITGYGSGYSVTPFLGDMNGDGKKDAVSITSGMVYVALSTGSAFGPTYTYWGNTGAGPRYHVADANGDGKDDVISGSSNGSTWSTARSTGTGLLAPTTSYNVFVVSPSTHITAGDFNGDNLLDLLTGYQGKLYASVGTGGGYGRWILVPSQVGSTAFGTGAASFLKDVNFDGKADALNVSTSGTWKVQLSTTSGSGPLFGSASTWISSLGGSSTTKYMMADVDGFNGPEGIAYTNGVWSYMSSSFATPQIWSKSFVAPTSSLPTTLLAGDTTGDGKAEPVSVMDGAWRVGGTASIPDQIKAGTGGYVNTWGDDFNGTAVDYNKWSATHYDYWLNGQPTRGSGTSEGYTSLEVDGYTAANNSVSGGVLTQKIGVTGSGASASYTIGSINSLGRIGADGQYVPNTGFRFKEGYVEARVKVPKSADCGGCWPAFWMLPAPHTDPVTGVNELWGHQCSSHPEEVDIFEFFPHLNDDLQYYDTHWGTCTPSGPGGYGETIVASNLDTAPAKPRQVVNTKLAGDFHTYGMLRTATKLQFFVDGIAGPEVTVGVPQKDMYLILTLQRGKDNAIPGLTFPATTDGVNMQTEYIQVWQ